MDLGSENRKKCYGNVTAIVCIFFNPSFFDKPLKMHFTKEHSV